MEIKPSVCGRKQNHQRFPIQKRTHTQPVRDSGQIRDIDGVVKLCPPVHAAYRIRHCRTTLPDSDSGLLMRRFAFAPIRHCTVSFQISLHRSSGIIFFSTVNFCVLTLTRCPFHPRVTAVARKRPRPFCQKCTWQVTSKHAYTLDRSRSGLTMPLFRHSVGTYPETNSHATCQGTLGHIRLSLLNHCGLILA